MPQKKKTNKKSHKKKHLNPKQTILYQSIPNYSSGQNTGHQNNKNVSFSPSVQQESRTDNLVGDLVSRLIGKIENDGNKQTQEYSKEIQPINNNNVVNVYKDGTVAESSSGSSGSSGSAGSSGPSSSSSSSGSSGSSGSDAVSRIQESVKTQAIDATSGAIGGAITTGIGLIGTAIYKRKKLTEGIKNLFKKKNDGIKLGGDASSSRLKEELQPIMETTATKPKTKPPKLPKGYHEQVPTNPEMTPVEPTTMFSRRERVVHEAAGTGMRTPRQSLSRSSSSSSNYRSGPVNLVEEFSNSTPTQNIVRSEPQSTVIKRTDLIKQQLEGIFGASSARKSPALNSEERKFVEKTLKKQNLDPSNLSPVNPDILRTARPSAIQRHDGVLTRNTRAQIREPHVQLQMGTQTQARRVGRPRTRPFGPELPSNPRGRPRTTMLSQAETPVPTRQSVTRKMGTEKKK